MDQKETAELDAESAINSALQAERQAQQAVERCEMEAEAIVREARREARRIGERTDRRISSLHARCAKAVDRRIAAMLEEEPPSESPEETFGREREVLEAAVARVAEMLTTEPTGDSDI